jgi:hypothetical protein
VGLRLDGTIVGTERQNGGCIHARSALKADRSESTTSRRSAGL